MRLSEVLRSDAVLLDLKGIDKWSAVEKLTDVLVTSGQVDASLKGPTLEALLARERSASTGMQYGVAIPHCSVEYIDRTLVSIGISREGIEFDSLDGQPTHVIFLLVTPKNRTRAHIKTLADIAQLLNHEDYRRKLLEAEDAETVIEVTRLEEESTLG